MLACSMCSVRLGEMRLSGTHMVARFLAALAFCLSYVALASHAGAPGPPAAAAQVTSEWQTAVGAHSTFEVASIRPAAPGPPIPSTVGLNIDDEPVPVGGRFVADSQLDIFIEFAYRIWPTPELAKIMFAHVPKWVTTESFVIAAKMDGNPTKDQVRLMMQSLLADRFKFAAHFETRTMPVLALIPLKPGKTGPRLRPHADGLPCDANWIAPADRSSPSVPPGGFLPNCGTGVVNGPNHTVLLGSRNATIDQLATYIGQLGVFGRPLVNQTGITGRYDFSINWMPESHHPSSTGTAVPIEDAGPTLLEALQEQLGLKLKPINAPVQILVIDHVEQPSQN